jgi:hypothetical protein
MPPATLSGEPDAGNPQVRFDEGAARRALRIAGRSTLLGLSQPSLGAGTGVPRLDSSFRGDGQSRAAIAGPRLMSSAPRARKRPDPTGFWFPLKVSPKKLRSGA